MLCSYSLKDEEGWISAEDLYTEGSSDEEITHRAKLNKIKNCYKKPSISPLAQHNSFLPEISPPNNLPIDIDNVVFKDYLEASNMNIKAENFENSASAGEHNSSIEWRPKRGSLQLPTFSEGITFEVEQNS